MNTVTETLDLGFGRIVELILDRSTYRIVTMIENGQKIYHENRSQLFDRLQVQMYDLKSIIG